MDWNGLKWTEMEQNGTKWTKMDQNRSKRTKVDKMDKNEPKFQSHFYLSVPPLNTHLKRESIGSPWVTTLLMVSTPLQTVHHSRSLDHPSMSTMKLCVGRFNNSKLCLTFFLFQKLCQHAWKTFFL